MRTTVLACAKLENNYLREWVEWYKNLGFTNVIIYDNNDPDGERFEEVIDDYIKEGFVIVEDIRGLYPGNAQYYAYQGGYDKYGAYYDWVAIFDIDEFLVLDDRFHNNINEYLSMGCFIGRDLIRVPWRMYGDNGLVRVKNGDYSLMNRFKEPLPKQDRWTKAIVHGGIPNLTIPQWGDGQVHIVNIPQIKDAVDANGMPVRNDTIRGGCGYENAALNHYSTKTIEEFVLNKIKKGYATAGLDPDVILNMDYFFSQNERTREKEHLYNELIGKVRCKNKKHD